MKVLKYLFGILGGTLALVAFFLPWIHTTFAPTGISGRNFTLGFGSASADLVELIGDSAAISLAQGDGWLWVILSTGILALLAMAFSLVRLEKANVVTGITLITSGFLGFAFLYLRTADFLTAAGSTSTVMLSARNLFQGISPIAGLGYSAGSGLYMLVTALFLMIIGGIFSFAPTSQANLTVDLATQNPIKQTVTPSPFPVQNNRPLIQASGVATVLDAPHTIADTTGRYETPSERIANPRTIADNIPQRPQNMPAPAQQAKVFAWLIVRKAEGLPTGSNFTISTQTFTIGRGNENMLRLTDKSVSTKHAEIQQREGLFFVQDLGSSNGTFIFDRLLNDWRQIDQGQLSDGDQLRFGRSIFSFINVAS